MGVGITLFFGQELLVVTLPRLGYPVSVVSGLGGVVFSSLLLTEQETLTIVLVAEP